MNQENEGFFEIIARFIIGIFKEAAEITEKSVKALAKVIRWVCVISGIFFCLLLINELNSEMNLWYVFIIISIGLLIGFISKSSKIAGYILSFVTVIAFVLFLFTVFFPGVKSVISSQKSNKDNLVFKDYIAGTQAEQEIIEHYKDQEDAVKKQVKKFNKEGKEVEACEVWANYLRKGEELKKYLDSTKKSIYGVPQSPETREVKNEKVEVAPPRLFSSVITLKKGERRKLLSFPDNSTVYFESDGSFSVVERSTYVYDSKKEDKIPKGGGISSHYYTWGGAAVIIADQDINIKAWVQ